MLQCLNDTCVLADPLSTTAQNLLDNGIATIDAFLEGCYESYTKNDTVPEVILVGGSPTMAPRGTDAPSSSAGIIGPSVLWMVSMVLL